MKEHPILFSPPMVKAIVDGHKTQTRRVVKPQPDETWCVPPVYAAHIADSDVRWACGHSFISDLRCPHGAPGDHLYVRETWRTAQSLDHLKPSDIRSGAAIEYKDGSNNLPSQPRQLYGMSKKWRPSIFMPRWASRLTLEITDVRVEPVRYITPHDACAEGVKPVACCEKCSPPTMSYTRAFAELWEELNGCESWEANPWVIAFVGRDEGKIPVVHVCDSVRTARRAIKAAVKDRFPTPTTKKKGKV